MLTSCCCWGSAVRGWLGGATEGLLLASLLALVAAVVSPVAVLELEPGLLELLSTVPGPL